MNPIEVHGLKVSFRGGAVLSGLDLTLKAGTVYGLLGRNGAGKTTLLKTLMGFYRAEGGQALVLGSDLSRGCPPAKRKVSYVGEGDFLPGFATVDDLIGLETTLREREAGEIGTWLAKEGIERGAKVGRLSKGTKKRLELELLLLAQPEVMLLDEPFDGLDPVSRKEIMGRLAGYLADHEATVLVSSHILGDLERLCDRIGILAHGKIALEDSMDRLKRKRKASLEELGSELLAKFEAREVGHV
jgi:ABC-2 type transport system ATP-binding protein